MNSATKLHLGCGERFLPGYIHIDINKFDHIDYFSEIDNLDFIEDNSVDEIYASHVLEYYDVENVKRVLEEWKRILKSKGMIRMAVPNFENLVNVYSLTKNIDDVIGPIIGRWKISDNSFIYHKNIFDKKKLTAILTEAGFIEIKEWDWREFIKEFPDYDDHSQAYFPHMNKESGIHVSLNLSCIKK